MHNSLRFVDLFSGAGGLSCGLEMADHQCLLGVDFDFYAVQTFAKNHPKARTFCGKIETLTNNILNELLGAHAKSIDLVVGGPPCQGFSTIGKGDPKDDRNKLFKEYIRIVGHLNPSFIIMENVTGLLAKKNEPIFKKILKEFLELGYNLNVKVLEAYEFGVAQRRRRTIFLGSKINNEIEFPKPICENSKTKLHMILDDLEDQKGTIWNHHLEDCQITKEIDLKRLQKIPEGKSVRYKTDEQKYWPKSLWYNHDWETLKEGRLRQAQYQRLDRNLPAPTINTSKRTYYHPTENRYLSIRELAKIQSFPNNFVFVGSSTSMYRQVGNAVPPLLGKVLGEHLKILLQNSMEKKTIKKKFVLKSLAETLQTIRSNAFNY